MTSRDFCFWLQGFLEVTNPSSINTFQTDMLKNHLKLVFKHEIDPSMPDPTGALQLIHDGKPPTYCAPPAPTIVPQTNSFSMTDNTPNLHTSPTPFHGGELLRC